LLKNNITELVTNFAGIHFGLYIDKILNFGNVSQISEEFEIG